MLLWRVRRDVEAIPEHAGTIDVTPDAPQQQLTFDQAYLQTIVLIVDEMLESRPVERAANELLTLHANFPNGVVQIGGFTVSMATIWPWIVSSPPEQIKAALTESAPSEDIKRRLTQSTTAEQWIAQLQKNLKIQK